MSDPIQNLCEHGQAALLATDYLAAERYLAAAESLAWRAKDYDALARLYMPLQEARRQRRQQSADGPFVTRMLADTAEVMDLAGLAQRGQFVVAGRASVVPAVLLRAIAAQRGLVFDVPLAAAYRADGQPFVLIVPTPDTVLPFDVTYTVDGLMRAIPVGSVLIPAHSLPPDQKAGDTASFGYTMSLWERLHEQFLAAADALPDGDTKIEAYRQTIRVDYACEFAHQRLSETARRLSRKK